jgi:hypothetical protein
LGLLDVPPVQESIWQAWLGYGRLTVTAWTARAALARLIEATQPRRVWMPAYICRELACAGPGASLRFYPLDAELSPDVRFLRRHVAAGDLALVADYFGWPPKQEVIDLAAERPEVTWVEDRAQCLWTAQPPWAPWLLFSPRKVVGVPDGGLLIARPGADLVSPPSDCADASLALPELMRFEDAGETENTKWHAAFSAREARFSAAPLPLSRLTSALLQRLPIGPLIDARRKNFAFLADRLSPYRAWSKPHSGIAPFGLPIIVADAAALASALAEERLFCARHWAPSSLASEAAEFPREHALASRLLTLPCDHRYDEAALTRLVDAVRRLAPSVSDR